MYSYPNADRVMASFAATAKGTRMVHELVRAIGCALVAAVLTAESLCAQNVFNAGNDAASEGDGLPLWELGAGIAVADVPAYPGASVNQTRAVPLPIVVYRGRFFRAGDGALVSGKVVENERFELDLSLSGSFNADSDDVDVRRGMPDLGFLFEIGPELEWHLTPETSARHWKLELPVRAAFSVDDGSLNGRGWVFTPELELELADVGLPNSELSIGVSPMFATDRLADYLYAVPAEFATPSRPTFNAKSGFVGTRFGVNWAHRSKQRFVIVGLQTTWLQGAQNDASPLIEDDVNISLFAAVAWSLVQSKRRVRTRADDER